MRRLMIAAAVGAIVAGTASAAKIASAAEYEVRMLNKGEAGMMVFEPAVLEIKPGDTVRFVPADKGHNVLSIDGMTPEGGVPFSGNMNQEVTVTFDAPGVYGYECKPHYGLGMVGLIIVGDSPANLDQAMAVKQRGKARQRFEKMFKAFEG